MTRIGILVVAVVLAAGCARPPRNLAGVFPSITVGEAQQGGGQGETVRWGGLLVETSPQKNQTCFEIVSRRLDRQARPEPSDESGGRFLACAPGFYDPTVYAPGREVTVVGTLRGEQTGKVGGYDYRYPMVEARAVHLWEEPRQPGARPSVGISIGGVFGSW